MLQTEENMIYFSSYKISQSWCVFRVLRIVWCIQKVGSLIQCLFLECRVLEIVQDLILVFIA